MTARPARPGLLTQLRGDRRGVSAVEFALLAPIMVAFYFGLVEFCQGYMAQKRMGHVSATVADLVARSDELKTSDVTDIFKVGTLMMSPFPTTTLKQRVSQVTRTSSTNVKVDWSQGDGLTKRSGTVTVPTDLIANGESVILAEVTYDYDSPVDYLMPGLTTFSHTYYLRPRRVNSITYTTN